MPEQPAGSSPVEVEIPALLVGERLDRAVALLFGLSRTAVSHLIADGSVTVNGEHCKASARLPEGAICVNVPEESSPLPQADPKVAFQIVQEDAAFFVVNKPAGLVVHPAPGAMYGTLVNGLLSRDPNLAGVGDPLRPGIVHRLDRDTSGLLIVARTHDAYEHFVAALSEHEVERTYVALLYGHLADDNGVIDASIGRDPRQRTRMAVRRDGKPARTAFTVLQRITDPAPMSVVRCRLETGRTHQIRVHLAAIGHPVVADGTYAPRRARSGVKRTFLHAAALRFVHPSTGELVEFHAPLPGDLRHWVDHTATEIDAAAFDL